MNAPTPPLDVSDAERTTRIELAALYRVVAHFRMTDMIDTHISARLPGKPGEPPAFLINRYGVLFDEMRASDLVKIDYRGNVIDERAREHPEHCRVNAAGFTIHSAVHMAREDVAFVVHTHTAAGIGVSAQRRGLLPISQHALKFYGKLAYHDYEGIALDLGERERLVADLGPHNAMILRNHGLLACGKSVADAFHEIYFLERACQAQINALAGGVELNIPPPEVCARTAAQFAADDEDGIIDLAWQAALRLIETGPDARPVRTDYRS
ncbi:class II aldolase/adducin family protein [Paraburkholderia caballeronis]|uniref:Ribulose-5-phosphate 4-epimerase/Fuculose-1-phosphate aldolase n=1 Tax=Paraburkholderia caballeronis TaxID=416943 RepID=A0A1H7NYL4_9BURK|nr:class II aldolase/adducin family protein [Paraburkholderia caballeronis]PXW25469.1 ribulose-5-phosphate 4-epimerase/fuculose-1-phosphate aldolase [Paraburkholderia caballeronis]PXX01076.1 ribulose-5-phosphate 4-epimerase/fuculose-1-phosphate aldolase [Paraburkholderia caballeronis]RAJ99571.1 ribulose-5-phosphate 4-epimerase/fuculose-1-phosphate aldolase [Paraburkholderia caballeronis]TDV11450.1 ribulose-5-phosphate 4-epimerase/fuculose-1-phosphate aldolase [Paraburkholderia caballeronis]TDV